MRYLKIFYIFSLCSCCSSQELIKVQFNQMALSSSQEVIERYTMKLTKSFELRKYLAGGEVGESNEFWYKDSSVIYITDFPNSLNYDNIQSSGYGYERFEFKMGDKAKFGDTLVLSGITKNNLYWKEILVKNISIGYMNVTQNKKEIFDNVLKTFQEH
jgi:hypothetical protein